MIDDRAFRQSFEGDLAPTNLAGAYATSGLPRNHGLAQPALQGARVAYRQVIPVLEPMSGRPTSSVNVMSRGRRTARMAGVEPLRSNWTSPGWSGTTVSGAWQAVSGFWTIPTVSIPPVPPGPDGIWWMYSWVGLDGAGSNELLQIGIDQRVHPDGSTECHPWYEWLAPPSPDNPAYVSYTRITNVDVHPGDVVWGYVAYIPAQGARKAAGYVELANHTTGRGFSLALVPPPLTTMPGATLDWIVEDPGGGYPGFALAMFTPVTFTQAFGVSHLGAIGHPSEGDIWNIVNTAGTVMTSVQVAAPGSNDPNETVNHSL